MLLFVLGAVLGLYASLAESRGCLQATTVTRVVRVKNTQWQEVISFPQFDGTLGVLDVVRINISWTGNATYHYGFFENDEERAIIQSTFTPQLASTVLGLAYPAERTSMGDYNVLVTGFNRDFEPVQVWNRAFPSNCPDGDINLCDVNARHFFSGEFLADVNGPPSVLSSFTATGGNIGVIDIGGIASGSATGRLDPSPGGPIEGTLAVGVIIELTYFWTSIVLEKRLNNVLQRTAPGPLVAVGSSLSWSYNVTNYGSATLTTLTVTDDQGVQVTCPTSVVGACSSVICTGTTPSSQVAGAYRNIATCHAKGLLSNADYICPSDEAHYFGVNATIHLNKYTNGARPDAGSLIVGRPVTWNYEVHNTGNVDLTSVAVTDNRLAANAVSCPATALAVDATMVCSAVGTVVSDDYVNVGSVTGVYPPLNLHPFATDANHYFGVRQTISVVKFTNDVDIRNVNTPRPFILVGAPVTWKYAVTNTGNGALSNVGVNDNHGFAATCPTTNLGVGSSIVCSATGVAVAADYTNVGTAHGVSSAAAVVGVEDATATATSPSAYFGVVQSISVRKHTNNVFVAVQANQPAIKLADPVTWRFDVTNTGNSDLSNVHVTDNRAGAATCPSTTLVAGATVTCTITGSAQAGQYDNVGTAFGTSPVVQTVTSTSPSSYFGVTGGISLDKFTNGLDTNPFILVGGAVTWTYIVSNVGNADLTSVAVVDSHNVQVNCPSTQLSIASVMTCTGTGSAVSDQYTNLATATAYTPVGPPFGFTLATDSSRYFGVLESVTITKFTNNVNINGDMMVRPVVLVSNPVTWRYEVTNTGNQPLSNIVVDDSMEGNINSCTSALLAVGSTMTCAQSATARANDYVNVGTVRGTTVLGRQVSSTNPSGYFGVSPGLSILKLTNGVDIRTDSPPFVLVGDMVTWTYEVSNIGNSALSSVVVNDNRLNPTLVASCPSSLALSGTFTCTATGLAVRDSYDNTALVQGLDEAGHSSMASSDSAYFGVVQSISVVKTTNGVDRRSGAPRPYILSSGSVTWQYTVTNTGNTLLSAVNVRDTDGSLTVVCPATQLDPTSSFVCAATGQAIAGDYSNIGTAHGVSEAAVDIGVERAAVTATSPSGYFGVNTGLSLTKFTNEVDVRQLGHKPFIPISSPVTWTYVVENLGNTELTGVTVFDAEEVTNANCPSTSLPVEGTMTCTWSGTAAAGEYTNLATATGFTPPLTGNGSPGPVTADSDSGYFGLESDIMIVKLTNGVDIQGNVANAPHVLVGTTVTWTYSVTNPSNNLLSNVHVSDNRGVAVSCPQSELGSQSSMVCTGSGTAHMGDYDNVGTAFGDTPLGTVTATSTSAYYGVQGLIDIRKFTNGQHPNSQLAGPLIESGTPVTWSYEVTNVGNTDLSSVQIVDNQIGAIGGCFVPDPLVEQAKFTCTVVGTAGNQPYSNVATAFGLALGRQVTDTDVSFYNPRTHPGVRMVKRTNGVWTKDSPIPHVRVGSTVTWTYEVSNTGDSILTGIKVTDDLVSASAIQCPNNGPLAQSATMTCIATGSAIDCLYNNVGCVEATGVASFAPPVKDCSQSSYIGMTAAISILKFTNHFPTESVHQAPGPCVEVGEPVWWHYVVSNVGDDILTGITVHDDKLPSLGQPICPDDCLKPWHSMTCKAHGTAAAGNYTNVAIVTGHPETTGDPAVNATDQNWHRGVHAAIRVHVKVNGEHQDCGVKHDDDDGCSVAGGEGEGEHGHGEHGHGGRGEGRNGHGRKLLGRRDFIWDGRRHSHGPDEDCKSQGGESFDDSAFTDQVRAECPAPIQMFDSVISFTFVVENTGNEDVADVTLEFDGADAQGNIPYVSFKTTDVHCPQTTLEAGRNMTCLVLLEGSQTNAEFIQQRYGRQKLSVKARAHGACDSKCVQHRDQSHWFTPGENVPAAPQLPADDVRVFFVDQAIEVEPKTEGCCDKKDPELPPRQREPQPHRRHHRRGGEGEGRGEDRSRR